MSAHDRLFRVRRLSIEGVLIKMILTWNALHLRSARSRPAKAVATIDLIIHPDIWISASLNIPGK
ncbi:hypothetical protein X727_32690 [Mesorhizobium sp. L103C119B0]|nr:hypothetical protein X765_14900 [Mesorhizobium sp. LSHC440B00]ESZ55186.1 hypothetical protein X729_27020 [Mesorhizobium sp. L103C131B0]ESZ56822.1 hypothetical protein X727_32690 [Mesorhizobium sp. L103C119B0]